MRKVNSASQDVQPRQRPAETPEARENRAVSLAYDLVEKRLMEGTATSQETTLFLKIGREKEKYELELEILEKQKHSLYLLWHLLLKPLTTELRSSINLLY